MKRLGWLRNLFMICLLLGTVCLVSCGEKNCTHEYGEWLVVTESGCTSEGVRFRVCDRCGNTEIQTVPASGHTEVIDAAKGATCSEKGLTEGKHCSRCDLVILAQEELPLADHIYYESILSEPTCVAPGTKQYACSQCENTYTEEIFLKEYDATEIYELAAKTVGEIVTYNKNGEELALGTGFVYGSDGRIVTNYHVLEGAYNAKFTINGVSYGIQSVLAYDRDIDLAVVKIQAKDLDTLTLCTEARQVGKTVYALGSSKGLTATFSRGIITYAERKMDGVTYVQHDAAISSGNSGGPLINQYGEIIGINTMTIRDSQNLNFAIATSELSRLDAGDPLTMKEFYEKEGSPISILKRALVELNQWESSEKFYWVGLGKTTVDNVTMSRYLYYYPEEDSLCLIMFINDNSQFVFYFSNDAKEIEWVLWDPYDDYIMGFLKPSDLTQNTKSLSYAGTSLKDSATIAEYQKLSAALAVTLCALIDYDFYSLGITAADLGFVNF